MSKTTKTILIVAGSLLVVCACCVGVFSATGLWSTLKFVNWAESNTSEDPEKVAEIALGIADFQVPESFYKQYGMKLGTLSLVEYMTGDEETFIFITQFPAGTSINVDEMMRQISRNSRNPGSPWYNMDTAVVDQKTIMVRGEETTLSISEGTSDQGVQYRMATANFQGRGEGPAILMVVGPAEQWDEKILEDFIASIR